MIGSVFFILFVLVGGEKHSSDVLFLVSEYVSRDCFLISTAFFLSASTLFFSASTIRSLAKSASLNKTSTTVTTWFRSWQRLRLPAAHVFGRMDKVY